MPEEEYTDTCWACGYKDMCNGINNECMDKGTVHDKTCPRCHGEGCCECDGTGTKI